MQILKQAEEEKLNSAPIVLIVLQTYYSPQKINFQFIDKIECIRNRNQGKM